MVVEPGRAAEGMCIAWLYYVEDWKLKIYLGFGPGGLVFLCRRTSLFVFVFQGLDGPMPVPTKVCGTAIVVAPGLPRGL